HTFYITVMSFNIWMSASHVKNGLKSVAEVIKENDPDIVGIQEISKKAFDELKMYLGKEYYFSWDAGTISKFPILDTLVDKSASLNGYGVLIQLYDGMKIRFFNSHLIAYPYGPYMLRDKYKDVENATMQIQGKAMGA